MNPDLLKLWLSVYPNWPVALAQKFADEIDIQSNLFNGKFGISGKNFYDDLTLPLIRPTLYNTDFSFFNPQNIQFRTSYHFEFNPPIYNFSNMFVNVDAQSVVNQLNAGTSPAALNLSSGMPQSSDFSINVVLPVSGNLYYDSRLFSQISMQTAYWTFWTTQVSVLFIMSYNTVSAVVFKGWPQFAFKFADYAGTRTLLILHENGLDMNGIDYPALYDFVTYLNAYEKNAAQIQSKKDLVVSQLNASRLDYQRQLSIQMQSEQDSLQNLAVTLQNQMSNEIASEKRDTANLIVSAQNLKLQFAQSLKG